jgi:hypothetical protein
MSSIVYRRDRCRACDGRDLDLFFRLRPTPIGDAYVRASQVEIDQPSYPIDLYVCTDCGLAQLLDVLSPESLYGEYLYVTTSSMGLSKHFEDYAASVTHRCKLVTGELVVDIGSNDGTLLRHFQNQGMKVLGVEPAVHIANQATLTGIETLSDFFNSSVARKVIKEHGKAKLVTANNVFANIDDLIPWISAVKDLLSTEGVFIFESYYLSDLLDNFVFDFIYHEHLSAFSVKPVRSLFERVGLQLVAVERVLTKGGSLRYFIQNVGGPLREDGSVLAFMKHEESKGLYRKETYVEFARKIDRMKEQLHRFLRKAKAEGKSIAGYGASVTGTTLIYHFELDEYLEYLVDDNVTKQGLFSPGLHLEVFSSNSLQERKPDYVVLLAWRFAEIILEKNKQYIESGGCFLLPVPEFKIFH